MENPDWLNLAIRFVGILGILTNIVAFQCKKHGRLVLYKSLNEGCFGLQYLLLGACTGFGMNCISLVRNFIFRYRVARGKSNLPFQLFFSLLFLILGLLTWEGPKGILVICAKILTTVAYGIRDTAKVRLLTLPSAVAWLIYNNSVGSYEGAINEAFTLGSILVGILRLDLPRRKEKEA